MTPASTLPTASTGLFTGFVALSVALAALFTAGVYWSSVRTDATPAVARRRATIAAVAAIVWMVATAVAAARGLLHFESPRTMIALFPAVFALAAVIALSPLGRRLATGLPIAVLVGSQSFRVIVELLMHRAYNEGLMPVQMSYSGRNFDIVTGLTAIVVALIVARQGASWSRPLVFAWNTLGVALLANILVVAVLSAPTPMRRFTNEPANVWITQFPWVWLPAVMVLAAIAGHVLVYRRVALDGGVLRKAISFA